MHKEQELFLLSITAQYVAEVQAGGQPRLSDYLVRYPRYANAIADFVAYYHAVEEKFPSDADGYLSLLSAELLSQVPAHQDEPPKEIASTRLVTTLLTTASGQRLAPSQIAAELNLSTDVVLLLEQGAIAPATIPHVLCQQVAMLLQQPIGAVQEYFCSYNQRQPGSVVHKKIHQSKIAEEHVRYNVPPVTSKLSFRTVVETSSLLSTEQKAHWSAILDTERI